MIATDIVQEGLDVPECSFVIRYEFVSNEIGTVQSRGRARAEKSSCYLVVGQSINFGLIRSKSIRFIFFAPR
jgi:ERCC4-related helicase